MSYLQKLFAVVPLKAKVSTIPLKHTCSLWLSCRFNCNVDNPETIRSRLSKNIASGHSSLERVITQPCLIYYLSSLVSCLQLTFPPTLAQCGWARAAGTVPSLTPSYHIWYFSTNPSFGIQLRSKWMKTICVIIEVIHQVRLDGAVVSSGHSPNPSLSNTCWAIFKSKHDGKIPMQDGKPAVDTYRWVSWGVVKELLELYSSR